MEVIERRIPYKYGDLFHIYPLGDIHFGSLDCCEDEIEAEAAKVKQTKNALIIGMGDYCDSILKNDPRFNIEGLADWLKKGNIAESQRKRAVRLFTPVKGKIICLLTGNHEEELHFRYQEDITRNICNDLGVRYGGYQCFIRLVFERENSNEKHQVIIHAWHGAGAAQTEGARLMRLVRLVNEMEADIYLMGHLHAITQHTPDRLILRNGKIRSSKLNAVITGSWLKGYAQPENGQELAPSYVERQGYKPNRIGCPVIHIRPTTGEVTIES